MFQKQKSFFHILVLVILIIATGVRLVPILTQTFFFHFDSARDWLWVRDMVVFKNVTLVGPWTSLEGVFYGPLTYYLLAIFFSVFGGNPLGGSIYALLINVAAIIIWYLGLLKQFNQRLAILGLILLSFGAISLNTSTFIFQANPGILVGVLLVLCIFRLSRGQVLFLPWLMLTIGLGAHINWFWTVFLLPATGLGLYVLKLKIPIKIWLLSVIFLLLPLLPLVGFEFRHQFLQTRALINFIRGSNHSLGGNILIWPRLIDRLKLFFELWRQTVGLPGNLTSGLTLVAVAMTWILKAKLDLKGNWKLWLWLGLILVTFVTGAIVFPSQFKIWYLYGLTPIIVLITIKVFDWWWQSGLPRMGIFAYLAIFVIANTYIFLPQFNHATSENMKLFSNQLAVVKKVLTMGKDDTYAAYVYTQPIYDYPYQYLFWWQKRLTGRGPVAYAYLPQKYEYVLHKQLFDPPPQDVNTVYLIKEVDNPASDYRWETWIKSFWEYKTTATIALENGTVIETRKK